jgi:hypothetical protein
VAKETDFGLPARLKQATDKIFFSRAQGEPEFFQKYFGREACIPAHCRDNRLARLGFLPARAG